MGLKALEERLAADHRRRECIAVGRGATGIWIALDALSQWTRARKVVLPATLCTSPVAVTRLAGFEPLFCDVEPLSGSLDPISLAILLQEHGPEVMCVIAAHLYGQPARIDDIARVCGDHRIPLIEDAAQAYGATIHGKRVGSFGDISILSFGHTKVLEAGGGGAVLTDHPQIAEAMRHSAGNLPPAPADLAAWGADYRRDYYALVENFKTDLQALRQVEQLCLRYPWSYRYALEDDQADRILAALDTLPEVLAHRRLMEAHYRQALTGAPVTLMRTEEGLAPWRYNLLVPADRRDAVLTALRSAGYDASAWYPVVARFFEDSNFWRVRWPGAARIEQEIVNLWVDNSVNESRVTGACAVIRETLDRG